MPTVTEKRMNATTGEVETVEVEYIESRPPQVVSIAQAKLALLQSGYLDAVNLFLDNLPQPDRDIARIEWEYRTEVRYDYPLALTLKAHLELSDEEYDNLFRLAGSL